MRMTNPLAFNAGRLGVLPTSPIANIIDGAQLGQGAYLPAIDGATPLVLPMAVPIVLRMPTMFDRVPGMSEVFKALIERHAKTIDGLDFSRTLETETTPVGHDGQVMNFPTNGRRSQVTPTFTYQEVTGNLVWNAHRLWMDMMSDPDTQAAAMTGLVPTTEQLDPHVVSTYTAEMLVIQFDKTWRPENIIDGMIYTAMFPTDIGMLGVKKETATSSAIERTMTFQAVLQHNANTKQLARSVAEILGLNRTDWNLATPAMSQIDSRIASEGRVREVNRAVQEFQEAGT